MDERNEEGLSIGEFFKLVWSQKILALVVLLVVALLGTVLIYFGYNAISREYSVTYRMTLPGGGDFNSDYTYPDGTVFYYTSLVSSETLDAVKATDERFSDIENRDIHITYSSATTEESEYTMPTFTLTAAAGSFKDKDTARDFFVELARYPIQHYASIQYDLHTALTTYSLAKDDEITNYDRLLEVLSGQLSMLQSTYDSLVSTYGTSFTVTNATGDGVTFLGQYKSRIDAYFQSDVVGIARLDIVQNGRLKSEGVKTSLELQKVSIERQLNAAKATLTLMLDHQNATDTGSTAEIRAQQNAINSLQIQLDDVERYLGSEVDATYISTLDEIYTALDGFTTELENISKEINIRVANVTFMSNNIIEVEEIGILISMVISVLVGLIAAIITGYIVAVRKIKKSLMPQAEESPATKETPKAE